MIHSLRHGYAPVGSRRIASIAAVTTFAILCGLTPHATRAAFLIDQQVTLEVSNPTPTSVVNSWGPLTVGSAGVQVTSTNIGNIVNFVATISDEAISFSYPNTEIFNSPTFNGYVLQEDTPGAPPFTYAAVDPGSTLAGFTNARLSFDATHVYMNVEGLTAHSGQSLVVDFSPVPEPASLTLLAFTALPLLLRRQRS